MAFVIIRYKSSEDVLYGVNKLDDIIKISCFQEYKINNTTDINSEGNSQFENLDKNSEDSLKSRDFIHALMEGNPK